MRTVLLASLVSVSAVSPALAVESAKSPEASIPFVNHGGIREWRGDGRSGIYVRDQHGQWYHGTFMGSCADLPLAETIGIETRGPDTLDRFANVIVRGQPCALNSFVKSAGPPKQAGKARHGVGKVAPASTAPKS